MNPQGILKLSIKQDEFDIHRDNIAERVCDYYLDDGDINTDSPETSGENQGNIKYMVLDESGFLKDADMISAVHVGQTYYCETSVDFVAKWRMAIDGQPQDSTLDKLVTLSNVNDHTISIRPSKSSKLYNRTIILSLTDSNGNHYSSIKLEVVK